MPCREIAEQATALVRFLALYFRAATHISVRERSLPYKMADALSQNSRTGDGIDRSEKCHGPFTKGKFTAATSQFFGHFGNLKRYF